MLEALSGEVSFGPKVLRAKVQVTGGRNRRLAEIHNKLGVPYGKGRTGRVVREFLYLNEKEWDSVVLQAMYEAGLRRSERGSKGDRF